ncbi:hypothetical protein ADIMK_3392 [Marinobacterium lacunae]|uniref:Cyclic GMP-AMP synthase n=1 Tax=Marinobacterium lacunae TaxID=1232683 RepID=A0A081FVE6_9GAMM|nr:hypothetical protein [Marinobacterium lacunae]KEA62501.1 hypothetical protein ADIMK_3392 [Marinobacterium lacunae]
MTWNIHYYLANQQEGLISTLELSTSQKSFLSGLKDQVRNRTKEVFDEAKRIAREVIEENLSTVSLQSKISNSYLGYLSTAERTEISLLLQNMSKNERDAFRSISPRFWIQGSYKYNTLNQPYHKPPQEMDIDDGTYLPMDIFDNKPSVGHRLLILLVDASLKSLEVQNKHNGWEFIGDKPTCSRLKIPSKHVHIDVPMYAVPKEEFKRKEEALAILKASEAYRDFSMQALSESTQLESDSVYLAVRTEDKWKKSDPKIVADWFAQSVKEIGIHLRVLCRILKAWRDVQWDKGGPSSICLMKCAVDTLRRNPHDGSDLGETLRLLASHLPNQLLEGVRSPDPTDGDRLLFPSANEHSRKETEIVERARDLTSTLERALVTDTKSEALRILQTLFGSRVTNEELIKHRDAAPAYKEEPAKTKPVYISDTMASG